MFALFLFLKKKPDQLALSGIPNEKTAAVGGGIEPPRGG